MSSSPIIELFKEETRRSKSTFRQVYAVIWANLKILLSYKYWVVTDFLSTAASIVMYFFMGLQVDPAQLAARGYGEDYAAFALVGISTSQYLWICLSRLSHSIQHDIRGGTLETVAVTQIKMGAYFLGQTVRGYLISLFFLAGTLSVGLFVLRIPLQINLSTLTAAFVTFLLMILSNQAIGFITAGIVMVHKRGDPVTFMLAGMNEFLSGVLYPLDLLKQFPPLYALARLFPYTYALDALRKTLTGGAGMFSPDVYYDLVVLVAFSVILLPIGLKVLKWGYDTIRRNGTMATY
ncbi:MAG: ABC transporter permease [Candidatus Brockarchaeota archaeon]|nr:ABC transporter permease [Candidatus Brockarchaeota archaeon]